jgi:putative ABC transport system permease protein
VNITESILTALDSLFANKLRSALTMLGIIIGVGAVIALMAVGNGFSTFVSAQINAIGTNLIYIIADTDASGGAPTLTLSDVEALNDESRVPAVVDVAASTQGTLDVSFEGRSVRTAVLGVTPNYFVLNNVEEEFGGLLTQIDEDNAARVAVIGPAVATDLFDDAFPIGESIRINGVAYEVVGVTAEKGGGPGGNPDNNVYVPMTTAQRRLFTFRTRDGERAVTFVLAQARSENDTDAALTQITEVLRQEHNILYADDDDFELLSQTDLLDTVGTITSTLTLFLGAIAGISLLVGGIGIMNIMLVSVTERTREIGIRKALGALKRDILVQFLIEALFLSLIGGLIGTALGWTLSTVVGNLIEEVTPVLDISTIALAVTFSLAVGLVFGIYPAWRASGLQPIEALRYE